MQWKDCRAAGAGWMHLLKAKKEGQGPRGSIFGISPDWSMFKALSYEHSMHSTRLVPQYSSGMVVWFVLLHFATSKLLFTGALLHRSPKRSATQKRTASESPTRHGAALSRLTRKMDGWRPNNLRLNKSHLSPIPRLETWTDISSISSLSL